MRVGSLVDVGLRSSLAPGVCSTFARQGGGWLGGRRGLGGSAGARERWKPADRSIRAAATPSEREEEHPPLVFSGLGGSDDQVEILDRFSERLRRADLDQARHRESVADSRPGGGSHRADVVGEDESSLSGSPVEHLIVAGLDKRSVLDPNQVEIREKAEQAAHDAAVEVLDGGEAQGHAVLGLAAWTRARSRSLNSWYSGRALISSSSSACSRSRRSRYSSTSER